MTDLADAVALAEDHSRAWQEMQELIDEQLAPVFDGVRWTCRRPVSSEGEEQWTK